jgi:twitching motility protein PilT
VSLVPSLLQAIVHVDGEALVMHAGDKPYVVSPSGQVDLASRGLALDAVNGIVNQLLPVDAQRALDEFGAVQHELAPIAEFPGEQFTVVAARGGDDLWVEIRRRRIPDDDRIPDDFFPPPEVAAAAQPYPVYASAGSPGFGRPAREALDEHARHAPANEEQKRPAPPMMTPPKPAPIASDIVPAIEDWQIAGESQAAIERRIQEAVAPASEPVAAADAVERDVPGAPAPSAVDVSEPPPLRAVEPATQPAVVLPLARNPIRGEQSPPAATGPMSGLDRLLRLAAARGASTLYLSSDSRPGLRVDGELQTLEGEPVLTARDVESLLLTLMPERNHEALRTGAATEWILDIEDVGRVRCMSFRDHRGPGGVFRLMPTRSVSVEQLGLPRAVQNLVAEQEGLVLVAGPRSSGKRTLISAFVDMINRTRRDHVITIEREINIVHERGSSFISQREVRGNDDDLLAAARAALREDPDVLVIEDLRTADLMNVAFDASASGHLVLGGFSAHTATEAVDRIIDLYGPDHRRRVQLALAESLRGVVVQVLLKKTGGGRVAARELLLNTPAVSSVIAEGKTSQLPMAIAGGRRYGMMPLNDALVGLVQQNIVDGREAYRFASDRQGLLASLKQYGVDTSFIERLA